MEGKLKLLYMALLITAALGSCDNSDFFTVPLQNGTDNKPEDNSDSKNGYIQLGDKTINILQATLTNLPNENFFLGGQEYHCYQLKLEKIYPGEVILSKTGEALHAVNMDLSYSINFKFSTIQKDGPLDEEFRVEFLHDLELYYGEMEKEPAASHRATAFLYGDNTFVHKLNADMYNQYLGSQVRLKSGVIHMKKSGNKYQILFNGETEKGEQVHVSFNDEISYKTDTQRETQDYILPSAEIPENYIYKGGKYYRLDEASYHIFSPFIYQGKSVQTIQVMNFKEYYRYEKNSQPGNFHYGIILPHWKSNALVLQFQMTTMLHFQPGTYQVVSSDGIHSIGYGLGYNWNVPFTDFPDNTKLIGYYHTSTYRPNTLTLDEDPDYLRSQVALKSGQLVVKKDGTALSFSGSFTDAQGEEILVSFKAFPKN